MSEEKQIEEMAKLMCDKCRDSFGCHYTEICTETLDDAKSIYDKGYRKQRVGEWVLEHETYGKMICSNCKEEAPKKTVVDRTYTRHILNDKKPYCPNCGAKMKGGE